MKPPMRTRFRRLSAASLCIASMAASAPAQVPAGSGFTYQGRLDLSGAVINASADLQFRLFDSTNGGTQIGAMQAVGNVNVVDGLFTATVDFGADAFDGNARFLEIAVRSPAGGGSFVTLTPRQQLTVAPYARFAARPWATNGANISYTGGWVGMGTTSPTHRLHVLDNGLYTAKFENSHPTAAVVEFRNSTSNATWVYGVMGASPVFGVPVGAMYIFKQGQPGPSFVLAPNGSATHLRLPGSTHLMQHITSTSTGGTWLNLENTSPGGNTWNLITTGSDNVGGAGEFQIRDGSTGAVAINIQSPGVVGFGVASPNFRIELPNSSDFLGRGRANAWVTYSSGRWKDNVQTLDGALDKVMRLRGVSFDWKPEHGGAHDIGFVAEEVGRVVPELVTWEKDGRSAQGLAYDRVTALAVEAIKEQQSQIDSLRQANAELRDVAASQQQMNTELRDQIADLVRRIAAMEGAPAAR